MFLNEFIIYSVSNVLASFIPTSISTGLHKAFSNLFQTNNRRRKRDTHHGIVSQQGKNQENLEQKISDNMTEQSLIASAVYLELWVKKVHPFLEEMTNDKIVENIFEELSRIDKFVMPKVGPWAQLIGDNLSKGFVNHLKQLL